MSQEVENLLILAGAALFLGTFLGLWLLTVPENTPLVKKWKALIRFGAKTKTPSLCARHAVEILRPGKMAILDSDNCELCNRKSILVR